MKALMFGWEFPPHILGGLGTASFGLTRGDECCGYPPCCGFVEEV